MRRCRWSLVIGMAILLASVSILTQAETVITSGGSVLQGTIEFGIPADDQRDVVDR